MELFFTLYIIILVLISFLTLYYFSLRREENQKMELRPEPIDMEIAREQNPELSPSFREQIKQELENEQSELPPLPNRYNHNFIRLMIRDPHHLYTYWEISNELFWHDLPILRLYNIEENSFQDISINHEAENWYIDGIKPDNSYYVEIGIIKDGQFMALARSGQIKTPPNKPSLIIDQSWLTIEGLESMNYIYEINPSLFFQESLEQRRRKAEVSSHTLIQNHKP